MSASHETLRPARKRQIRRLRRTSAVLVATAVMVTGWAVLREQAQGSTPVTPSRPAGVVQSLDSTALVPSRTQPAHALTGSAGTSAAAARVAFTPCARNHRSQLVVVSVRRQHAWACAGNRTVLSTPVTTGATRRRGEATPRGTFAVQGLVRRTTLDTSADGSYPVRFWIPFHLGVWGFHDASWQRIRFGSPRYVTHGSHGCVHVPLAAMRRLFHWVHYGTRVRIT